MSKEVRVLIIGSNRNVKGGITSVIDRYLEYKFTSTKITFLPTYIEESTIKKLNFFYSSVFKYIKKLLCNEFDIAHIHMSYRGSFFRKLIIVFLSKIFNKKVILHLHGSEFKMFYDNSDRITKLLIRYILRSSSVVITLGDYWKKVVEDIEPTVCTEVFRNAVNIPKYKVNLNNEKFNVLFLGVLIKRKGIYELIEAIKIMRDKNLLESARLNFLIGGTGPEESEVLKKIDKYGLNDYIEMLGWVDEKDKEDICKKSQLLVLPSYNEGLPMSILEAMSYGMPVIATDVGSINEVVVNDFNGYLIDVGDSITIVKRVVELIENKEKWQDFSERSLEKIEKEFDEKIYFKKIEELYINLY